MPAKNELNEMYNYANANNLIGSGCAGNVVGGVQCLVGANDAYKTYWSSTEYSSSSAWNQGFYDGLQLFGGKSTSNGSCGVRAVRAFNSSSFSPFINSPISTTIAVGSAFNYIITATNSPISFSSSPLPSGLSLNPTTGVISGTPTIIGASNVTINAINAYGTGTATLKIIVTNIIASVMSLII